MFGLRRTRTAPSPYPRLAFHGIRCAQLLASLVVMAVMWYFLWNLIHEDFETPRTFWTLLAASLATMITLAGTLLIYLLFGLSPFVSLCVNGLLLALWAPSFAFLWYWTRKTLSDVCSAKTWQDETGIMICRIYKALFAFSALGLVSTLLALALDVFVFRRTISRGKYKQMDAEKPHGNAAALDAPGYSDARGSIGETEEQYVTPQTQRPDQSGYEVPEEQFNYDTSYHGGHVPDTERS